MTARTPIRIKATIKTKIGACKMTQKNDEPGKNAPTNMTKILAHARPIFDLIEAASKFEADHKSPEPSPELVAAAFQGGLSLALLAIFSLTAIAGSLEDIEKQRRF